MIEQQPTTTQEATVTAEQVNEAFALLRQRYGWEAAQRFHTTYRGTYTNVTAYGQRLAAELHLQEDALGALPDWLTPYVQLDYEGLALNDLAHGGEVLEGLTGLHIFERFSNPAVESTTHDANVHRAA